MYYILKWMLARAIPHVDGACIWLRYFDIALYIMFVRLLRLSIFKRLKRCIFFLLLYIERLRLKYSGGHFQCERSNVYNQEREMYFFSSSLYRKTYTKIFRWSFPM